MPTLRDEYDVVVVGAGPAGMAAASLCARSKLLTLLLDDQPGPGGRMYHAITTTPLEDRAVLGRDYWIGEKIAAEVVASGAEYIRGVTVTELAPHFEVAFSERGGTAHVRAMRVILAVGAVERPVELAGSGLAGVAPLGAAQMRLQSAGAVPQGRTVIAGSGAFVWRAAERLLNAGAAVEAILDTTPPANHVRAWRHLPGYLFSPHRCEDRALRRAVGARVAVEKWVTELRVEGEGRLVQVGYRDRSGAARTLPADNLLGVISAGAVIAEVRPDLARASEKIARAALARFLRGRRYLDTLYRPEASMADGEKES